MTALRASSLPALAQCSAFESGSTEWTESGTDRHAALHAHFAEDDTLLDLLPEDEQEGVRWAAEYIRLKAPMEEHPLMWETPAQVILDDFTEIPGRMDAYCGREVFDLKWRQRDYSAQMALYALARLQATNAFEVRVHILFAAFKRAEVIIFDHESASKIVEEIVAKTRTNPEPTPCDYCGWCAKKVTCQALNDRAQAVAAGREDWKLAQYHASELANPSEMAKALVLAKHLSKWCEAVEHFAKEMWIKKGLTIPGYELRSKAGKSSCHDILSAFQASGLDHLEFLKCCEIRLETSKENPDKLGLANVLKAKLGISKAAAKRELKKKLKPYLRTPKQSFYLKAVNEPEEEETPAIENQAT